MVTPATPEGAATGDQTRRRSAFTWRIAFLSVWVAAGLYTYLGIDRGWVPHDEGQFLQTAVRAKAGEMPHRDFDEIYTGGLTYLHAFALYWLDDVFVSFRLVLFVVFMLWVPVVFYLASPFGPPSMAAAVSALAVVWSVPNYPAPVPSWYNLFLAMFGVAAVFRYLDTDRSRWLCVAGLCGGLSVLVKVVGLYYVAGVLLFLLLREQSEAWARAPDRDSRARAYGVLISLGLLAFIGVVASTVRQGPSVGGLMLFVVPSATIALVLLLREVQRPPGSARMRATSLGKMVGPFLAGVAVPIALYVLLFTFAGAFTELYRGLFVAPQRRIQFASLPTPSFNVVLCAPILLLIAFVLRQRANASGTVVTIVGSLLGLLLVQSASFTTLYQIAWRPVVFMLSVLVVAAVIPLRSGRVVTTDQQKQALLIFVTATCSLVQFPFAAGIYFCYVAPLVGLSLAAACAAGRRPPHPIAKLLLVFYVLFAVFRVTPGFLYAMGRRYAPDQLTAEPAIRRMKGLRVFPADAQHYERLIGLLSAHAKGRALYAFPDSPEIYVLSETPNPTRTIYEFLADPPITDADVIDRVTRYDVGAVVINTAHRFSSPPSEELLRELRERFSHGEVVGVFEVRWRE